MTHHDVDFDCFVFTEQNGIFSFVVKVTTRIDLEEGILGDLQQAKINDYFTFRE